MEPWHLSIRLGKNLLALGAFSSLKLNIREYKWRWNKWLNIQKSDDEKYGNCEMIYINHKFLCMKCFNELWATDHYRL